MSKKKPFVLRLDAEMLVAVERWATDEFRSVNGQLEWIVSEALKKAKRKSEKKTVQTDENTE